MPDQLQLAYGQDIDYNRPFNVDPMVCAACKREVVSSFPRPIYGIRFLLQKIRTKPIRGWFCSVDCITSSWVLYPDLYPNRHNTTEDVTRKGESDFYDHVLPMWQADNEF